MSDIIERTAVDLDPRELLNLAQIYQSKAIELAGTPEGDEALVHARRYRLCAERIARLHREVKTQTERADTAARNFAITDKARMEEMRKRDAELAAIKGQEPIAVLDTSGPVLSIGYYERAWDIPKGRHTLYASPVAPEDSKDAERWRTYLKVYADEGMCAAEWDGPEAMAAYVDAAMAKEG